MNDERKEPSLWERVDERPKLSFSLIRQTSRRGLLVRFAAGVVTSVGAGLVTLAFGSRIGGIPLAFPAILAASLTLIEHEEDSFHAREDARGAIVGGAAMVVFAVVVVVLIGHLASFAVLLIAAVAWLVCALLSYAALWLR